MTVRRWRLYGAGVLGEWEERGGSVGAWTHTRQGKGCDNDGSQVAHNGSLRVQTAEIRREASQSRWGCVLSAIHRRSNGLKHFWWRGQAHRAVWYSTLIYRDVTKQLWLLCFILVSLLTTVKYYIIAILHRIISCEARIRFSGIYSWTKYTLSVFCFESSWPAHIPPQSTG
jgi:hypothetical protein